MLRVTSSLVAAVVFLACSSAAPGSSGGGSGGSGGSAGGGTASGGGSAVGGGSASGGGSADGGLTEAQRTILAARPYRVVVPRSYDGGTPAPLVVLLHGYGATGLNQDTYFGLTATAQAKGFILATPDGKVNKVNAHYWNATDACCDYEHTGVDDVAYVGAIIDDLAERYRVDPRRVFLVGHSNGGFMSHRYACEHAEKIAGIASLAGANWKDMAKCQPAQPLAVLQIHGTQDALINYDGGTIQNPLTFQTAGDYPSAVDSVGVFARRFGCAATLSSTGGNLDIDKAVSGAETTRQAFAGCADGGAAELWTMTGGSHIPTLDTTFAPLVWDFLAAHPKP